MRIHDSVSVPICYRDLHTEFFFRKLPKILFRIALGQNKWEICPIKRSLGK